MIFDDPARGVIRIGKVPIGAMRIVGCLIGRRNEIL